MQEGRDLCQKCTSTPIIDEVFILYNDGRLIDHMTRTLDPDMSDKDIRSSMIVAVQNYIDGNVANDIGALQVLKFGGKSVIVIQGKWLVMAVVLERGEADPLKEVMLETLKEGEDEFHDVLNKWDGDKEKLEDMNRMMKRRIVG